MINFGIWLKLLDKEGFRLLNSEIGNDQIKKVLTVNE